MPNNRARTDYYCVTTRRQNANLLWPANGKNIVTEGEQRSLFVERPPLDYA